MVNRKNTPTNCHFFCSLSYSSFSFSFMCSQSISTWKHQKPVRIFNYHISCLRHSLQKPRIGFLASELLQIPLTIPDYRIQVHLVLNRQVQSSESDTLLFHRTSHRSQRKRAILSMIARKKCPDCNKRASASFTWPKNCVIRADRTSLLGCSRISPNNITFSTWNSHSVPCPWYRILRPGRRRRFLPRRSFSPPQPCPPMLPISCPPEIVEILNQFL